MAIVGNNFVQGNVCEDATGNEPIDSALVKIEFTDNRGMVVKGPFFGVTDTQGDFIVFIDPIAKSDTGNLILKLFFHDASGERARRFTSSQGMDPENYL